MRKTVLNDLGTMSLGAAAIFFTRAFPSPSFTEFSVEMMAASTALAAVGVFLRYSANRWGE